MDVVMCPANLDWNAIQTIYDASDITEDSWEILIAQVHTCCLYAKYKMDSYFRQ